MVVCVVVILLTFLAGCGVGAIVLIVYQKRSKPSTSMLCTVLCSTVGVLCSTVGVSRSTVGVLCSTVGVLCITVGVLCCNGYTYSSYCVYTNK